MAILGPSGRPVRSTTAFGTRRTVHVSRLEAGMRLCDPIRGFRGKTLVYDGEVLTQKHVDQIKKIIDRPGAGSLLQYTREVTVQAALGSVDEKPACESDPYAAHSIQKLYKKGTKLQVPRNKNSSARKVYKMVNGVLAEVPA